VAAAVWLGVLVRQTVRWENLRTRGVTAPAYILYTQTVGNDNDGYKYYVHADVGGCDCVVVVRVTSPDLDSTTPILVRYDPRDHSNAVPMRDRPASTLGIGIAICAGVFVIGLLMTGMRLRMRRRCKSLVQHSAEKRSVTFRAWRRRFGDNKEYYLLVYEAETRDHGEPICCMPITWLTLRRLRAEDVLLLYSGGSNGAAALRREGTIILPSGPVKPGRWEQSLRWT
jgi:hypothetical protein